jgi:hypothetical protein
MVYTFTHNPKTENTGKATISDGHKTVTLIKPNGQPLFAKDLEVGRKYEVDMDTGKVTWPPRNRKARRGGKSHVS